MLLLKNLCAQNRGFILFMLGMLLVRSAIADWYTVPSGSMYPTLMIGDRIIADRVAYDFKLPLTAIVLKHLADPQRGDIVTFISPVDGNRLVKRLVGLPGDTIAMRDEVLYVNGVAASYERASGAVATRLAPDYDGKQVVLDEATADSHRAILLMPQRTDVMRSFGPITVPAAHYLMLGDNRDNSADSRYIGVISRAALTGRVGRVAFSLDPDKLYAPRLSRFGASVTE